MPASYVTIATYADPIAADLARLRLEDADIPVFIADDQTAGIYGGAIPSIGVRVQVPVDLEVEARNLLAAVPDDEGERALAEMWGPDEDDSATGDMFPTRLSACPSCNAQKIEKRTSPLVWLQPFAFLLTLSLWRPRHRWRCLRCGREWRAP